jgi:hypothetical protein
MDSFETYLANTESSQDRPASIAGFQSVEIRFVDATCWTDDDRNRAKQKRDKHLFLDG